MGYYHFLILHSLNHFCFFDLPMVHGVVNHFPEATQSIILEVASVFVAGFPSVNAAPVLVVVLEFALSYSNVRKK